MNKTISILLALTALSLAAFSARAQNLLTNGDFELPVIGDDSYTPGTPDNWTSESGDSLIFRGTGGDAAVWPAPQHGQQYVYIGNDGSVSSLSQSVTITNAGVTDLALVWHDSSGHSGDATGSPYSCYVTDPTNHTVFLSVLDAYHDTFGEWGTRSNLLALTAGTYTITFRPAGSVGGLGTLIDNVSLTPTYPDLVPDIHLAVNICWPGKTNFNYQLQYVTNAASTNWVDLGAPTPGADTNCFTDNILSNTQRYYRITRVP